MSTDWINSFVPQLAMNLLDVGVKSVAVLALTGIAAWTMRSTSAAVKHLVWLVGISLCLLLPLTTAMHPLVRIGMPMSPKSSGPSSASKFNDPVAPKLTRSLTSDQSTLLVRTSEEIGEGPQHFGRENDLTTSSPARPKADLAIHLSRSALTLWLGGFVGVSLYWILGWAVLRRRIRATRPVISQPMLQTFAAVQRSARIPSAVSLRSTATTAVPVVFGIWRPIIVLPDTATEWSMDRLRSVLLHELAHIQRGDCAALRLTQFVAALYWFNPLVWYAGSRLRIEQDRACDDRVIRQSISPADYARDLLHIAASLRSTLLLSAGTLAMARRSGLRLRIVRILDANINRGSASGRWLAAAAAVGVTALLAASAIRLSAQPTSSPAKSTSQPTSQPADWISATKVNAAGTPFVLTVLETDTEQPLGNAKIDYFNDQSAAVPFRGYTDAAGKLSINMPSQPSLVVQALGHVWRWVDFDKASKVPLPPTYTVHLEKGVTIGGKIVDDVGQPIAGAKVLVSCHFKPTTEKNERRYITRQPIGTDQNGEWRVDEAPAEAISLSVGAYDLHHLDGDWTPMRNFSDLSPLRDRSATWTLPRGTPITGTIFGPDGQPIPKADIAFGADQVPSNAIPYWHTDENGRYSIGVKPGARAVITASPHGFSPDIKTMIVGNQPTVVDFHLGKGNTISGTVVDADGRPVPNASVYFDTWRGLRSNPHPDNADGQGHFSWHNAPADTVYANVGGGGFANQSMVAMKAGEPARVVLQQRLEISGTVVDADTGAPVSKFDLVTGVKQDDQGVFWQRQSSAATFENGRFGFSPFIESSGYAVRVEADGYAPADSRVIMTEERTVALEFRLHRAANSVVKVANPDGSPAIGATAAIVDAGEYCNINDGALTNTYGFATVTVTGDGTLQVRPQQGEFRVAIVNDHGYAIVAAEQVRGGQAIALTAWATLDGTLKIGRAAGKNEHIEVFPAETKAADGQSRIGFYYNMDTDAAGHFHFDRMIAGDLTVSRQLRQPIGQGWNTAMTQSQTVVLKAGGAASVSLGGKGRAIRGRFIIPPELANRSDWSFETSPVFHTLLINGEPKLTTGETYGYVVASDGLFQIDDVLPGSYLIECSAVKVGPRGSFSTSPPLATAGTAVTVPALTDDQSSEPIELPPEPMKISVEKKEIQLSRPRAQLRWQSGWLQAARVSNSMP